MTGYAGLLADLEGGVPRAQISMVRRLLRARASLAFFLHSCMQFSGAPSESPARTCLKLFPVAPPYPWTIGTPPYASPRCRARWKKQQVAKLQVRLAAMVPSVVQDGDGLE